MEQGISHKFDEPDDDVESFPVIIPSGSASTKSVVVGAFRKHKAAAAGIKPAIPLTADSRRSRSHSSLARLSYLFGGGLGN